MDYNPQNGEVALPIGGATRTLAFTMGALMLFADAYPGGLQAGFAALSDSRLDAVSSFSYYALKARKKENDLPADFTPELCAEWVADLVFNADRAPFAALAAALAQSVQAVGNRMGLTTTTTTTKTKTKSPSKTTASPSPALT